MPNTLYMRANPPVSSKPGRLLGGSNGYRGAPFHPAPRFRGPSLAAGVYQRAALPGFGFALPHRQILKVQPRGTGDRPWA